MSMETELLKRKHPRLDSYDYSQPGAYFVTICSYNRRCILSTIVGRGLAPAEVVPTRLGEIAEEQLLALETRFPYVRIDKYVIMPNHIHAVLIFDGESAGASPRPTLTDVVCAYKSLTTKECKKAYPIEKVFQTSFYEHVIRGQKDYGEIAEYICNNPKRWELDSLYVTQ